MVCRTIGELMTIKGILLAGAALCCLSIAPALASSAPDIVAVAAHPGNVHVKTALHVGRVSNLTSSIAVSTSVSTKADYKVPTELDGTFYTFYDNGSFCNSKQKESIKLAVKKTAYATLSTAVQTLSGFCSTAPTKFYGDVYDLKTKAAKGKTDSFSSTLVGKKIHFDGQVYDINFILDVAVAIGR